MAISIGKPFVSANCQCYLDSTRSASYSGSGTTWYDLSGNGKNATLVNSPTYVNNAITFNGTNQYATIGSMGAFYPQGTISFLLNSSLWESYRNPCTTNYQGGNSGIRFEMTTAGSIGVVIGNDAGTYNGWYIADAGLSNNTWYYVTVVWNTSGAVYGFLNGSLTLSVTNHPYWPTQLPNVVVGNGFDSGRFFQGGISHFSLYNRALTSQEIVQNYSALGVTISSGATQVEKYSGFEDTGALLSMSSYTTAGTFTWTKPVGCNTIVVKVVGGGGGASGYCESGGSGGYSERRIDVRGISSVTVTVGSGGALAAYSSGNSGGTSSFGSYCTATGGYGSNTQFTHTGGQGGVGSGGDINLYGGSGTGHCNGTGQAQTARGGVSYWGGPKSVNRGGNPAAVGSGAPGSGGCGANSNGAFVGTAGESGAVVIWEYK